MDEERGIRWGWLKGMYIYTAVGAGGFGIGVILVPELMRSLFGMPGQDPVVFGVFGSVYLAFGLLSILALRAPLKFAPLLLLQLTYKLVWFTAVVLPLLAAGRLPMYGMAFVLIFASYAIGDLIAIPFAYLFARQPGKEA